MHISIYNQTLENEMKRESSFFWQCDDTSYSGTHEEASLSDTWYHYYEGNDASSATASIPDFGGGSSSEINQHSTHLQSPPSEDSVRLPTGSPLYSFMNNGSRWQEEDNDRTTESSSLLVQHYISPLRIHKKVNTCGALPRSSSFLRQASISPTLPTIIASPDNHSTQRKQPLGKPPKVEEQSIRFQVVIWHIGSVDVASGTVHMQFRVTLFWNASTQSPTTTLSSKTSSSKTSSSSTTTWTMKGRQKAVRTNLPRDTANMEQMEIDVPPISILNAVQFDIIGQPEVETMNHAMRWTCMYHAKLLQQDMRVDAFPHDTHQLTLRLGILAHRRRNQLWDRNVYKLALATDRDAQGSTRIPHGLIVDHVRIPDFTIINPNNQMDFEFIPLDYGSRSTTKKTSDHCLRIRVKVRRESGHYDKNVMPLLGILNVVAVSCLCRNFAGSTASTELIMSICFVEIGFRLSIDSRLPSVGYQIKAQRVLNGFFWILLFLALETNLVYHLVISRGWDRLEWSLYSVVWIDLLAAAVSLAGTARFLIIYYWDMIPSFQSFCNS